MDKHYQKSYYSIRKALMKNRKILKLFLFIVILFFAFNTNAQIKIEVIDTNSFVLGEGVVLNKTSFRGLSVVDDLTIWISGSKGTFAISKDGGKSFFFKQIKGYEKSDFRDIEAFDDKRAILMSSGIPAYILKTTDGGNTWNEVFKDTRPEMFLDAMDFWDENRGVIVGDPINNHFVLLETKNAGKDWKLLDTTISPTSMDSEAVFAASGTSLRCWNKNDFIFVTGGKNCRAIIRMNENLVYENLNIHHGESSQGAFSIAIDDSMGFIAVGGDYLCDSCINKNSILVHSAYLLNVLLNKDSTEVSGYKSCVEIINPFNFLSIACGTKGVDVLQNFKWMKISDESFNVVRKAKRGKSVFMAGAKGKIAKLIY